MAKKKFYAVKSGRNTGIYNTWAECEAQVKGFKGAVYKSFPTQQEALDFVAGADCQKKEATLVSDSPASTTYIQDSISVDAACSGNPGEMEYQAVCTKTGSTLFKSDVYPVGTNNLGEFLAIVDALRWLDQQGDTTTPIYSDSISGLAWVRNKAVKTNLVKNNDTFRLYRDIKNAIEYLNENEVKNPLLKWETKRWGESKADFGRK